MNPKCALVIDDQDINRKFIKSYLVLKGFEVETAENGLEAMKLAEQGTFTLVFSDIEMPVMNGLEFLATFKKKPGYQDIPVIMLTTVDKPEIIDRATKMGAVHYMIKPFTQEKMDAALQKAGF